MCCENYIIYKNFGDQPDIRCPIPRRQNDLDDADRSMLFICSAMHKTKVRGVARDVGCHHFVSIAYVLFPGPNRTRRHI